LSTPVADLSRESLKGGFPPSVKRQIFADADACLKRSVDQVPRHEILQTRQKLLEATPRHFGAVERKVRQTWPTEFWPRPVDRDLVMALAEARRQRQLDKEWFAQIQPYGPEGLGRR
jgi:hypothetical protein